MDWKEVAIHREQRRKEIDKRLKELNALSREIGTLHPPYVVAELISEQYDQVCRIETIGSGRAREDYLVLYDKNATQKQIQYKRSEVSSRIRIHYTGTRNSQFEIEYQLESESPYAGWRRLPADIEKIYNILIRQQHEEG